MPIWSEQSSNKAAAELANAFACLNRPNGESGFWDPAKKAFSCSVLGKQGERGVTPPDHRYTPFCLAGALIAHRACGGGDEEKLHATSHWLLNQTQGDVDLDHLYYGFLWGLVEAGITFQQQAYFDKAVELAVRSEKEFLASSNLHQGVGLYALSRLLEEYPAAVGLKSLISSKARTLTDSINSRGIPAIGDLRAAYHQRLMYTCWGLFGSARSMADDTIATDARRILDFVTEQRIDDDGGIRWHSLVEWNALPYPLPTIHPYGFANYYECHQCFYLIALDLLGDFADIEPYAAIANKVFHWLYGSNRWGIDLTAHGIPGVPVRCVNRAGTISPALNHFKGSYELGSYLWAMSSIATSTQPGGDHAG